MKNLTICANWKSNMTKQEAKRWLEDFSLLSIPENMKIVLFAPHTLLDIISGYIRVNDLQISLGAQNLSPFDSGPHTGEISANQIKEFADYVLIGHSERRSELFESENLINDKIQKAKEAGMSAVICVSDIRQVKELPDSNFIIAYEPLNAIGTGNAEDPEKVSDIILQINKIKNADVLYGGSVNSKNVKKYTDLENVSGVLIGSASLDAKSFGEIINAI